MRVYFFDHNKLRYIGPETCPTFGKDALEHVWTCHFVVFQGKAPRACARVLSMCRCDLWESTISSLAIQCTVLSSWQLMDFVSTSSLLVFLVVVLRCFGSRLANLIIRYELLWIALEWVHTVAKMSVALRRSSVRGRHAVRLCAYAFMF